MDDITSKTKNDACGPDLSIIVLCYKSGPEAKTFTDMIISDLKAGNIDDYEIILVANYHPGMDDNTPGIVRDIAKDNKDISYISKPKPPGGMMGWDLKSGLEMAKGKYIVFIDGDGQMPVSDISRVYHKIKNSDFDLVKTYRLSRGDSLWRKVISWVFNTSFKILFPGIGSGDINSKPKIIRKEKYEMLDLSENGWCIDAEMMIQARSLRFNICEIPTVFLGLQGRRRSFVRLPAILEFVLFLFFYRVYILFNKL